MLKALRRNVWVVVADAAGIALLGALIAGGTQGSLFAALLLALPLAFLALLLTAAGR